jgi:hypothetical protein
MFFFIMGRKREGEADVADRVSHANGANYYSADGLGNLHATAYTKSNYLKILVI